MIIGGLDVGTTGCKLTLFNENGDFVFNSYKPYEVSRVNGEYEIDPETILESVKTVISTCYKNVGRIDGIGVTTFGETFVSLDKNDKPLRKSILYTDPRGEKQAKYLCDKIGEDRITSICAVYPHQMYSLPKAMWIRDNEPQIHEKTDKILLYEDFIVYMLSGVNQISHSLCARTLAFDIRNKCWSKEIFDIADIDMSLFSKPVPSGTIAGKMLDSVKDELGIEDDILIVTGAHDQVASALGAGVLDTNIGADGTGTVECVVPVFDKLPEDMSVYKKGYAFVPYVIDGTYACYVLSYTAGAVIKWYRDNFKEHLDPDRAYEILNSKISDKPTGILVLPHFSGSATPYMDNGSKAAIVGLTLEHNSYDIYKALMEGVSYEMKNNMDNLDCVTIDKVYATGGGAKSPQWLQIKADIYGIPVVAMDMPEVGAAGTAMLVAKALGIFENLQDAKEKFVKQKATYMPDEENHKKYMEYFEKYKNLYTSVRGLV